MNKQEIIAIAAHSLFSFADVMFRLFINLYIYDYTKGLIGVTIYTMLRLFVLPFFIYFAAKINERKNLTFIYSLSFIGLIISLIYLVAFSNYFIKYPYLVFLSAIFLGAGEGFYYYSTCYIEQLSPSNENRANFLSYLGFFSNILSIFSPIVANLLLQLFPDSAKAYRLMIILVIMIYILITFLSSKMTINAKSKKVNLKISFDLNDPLWKKQCLCLVISNLRDALDWSLTTIIISQIIQDSLFYSKFQIFLRILSVISCLFLIKLLKRKYLKKTYLFGAIINFVGLICLVFMENIYGALIYGLSEILSNVFFWNCFSMVSASVYDKYKDNLNDKLIGKEFCCFLGRMIAFLFIILCYKMLENDIYYKVPLLIFSLVPLIVYKLHIKEFNSL